MRIPVLSNLATLYRLSKIPELRDSLENPSTSLYEALAGKPVKSGVTVNERTSLQVTAVFACVRVIAESLASLPLPVYRRLSPRGKERFPGHPLYEILHDRPNPYMSAMSYRETKLGHVLLWGNTYSEIEYSGGGDVKALWPLRPDMTRPEVDPDNGKLFYVTTIRGDQYRLPPERVLHVPGLGFDGIRGYSVIRLAKEAVGLALAIEQYGASFFGNNASPGGVLQRPAEAPELKGDALRRLKTSWAEMHQGLENSHRVAVLEEGTTWQQIGVNPQDAQALEVRKFQIAEICRLFRVPPHKIADLDRSTNNNIEHQSIEFVTDTIRPWAVRLEQAMNYRLFTPRERREFFAEHLIDGLLRGDIKSRYDAYHTARQDGVINADEWRELENMNPQADGQGKVYLVQLNMVPANVLADMAAKDDGDSSSESNSRMLEIRAENVVVLRRKITESYRRIFIDTSKRVIRRERNDVFAASAKMLEENDIEQFLTWLIEFYENHIEFTARQFGGVYAALADAMKSSVEAELGRELGDLPELIQFVAEYTKGFAKRHAESSKGQLEAVVRKAQEEGKSPSAAVETRLDEWEERRPKKIADWETIRGENAFVKQLYISSGVSRVRWVTAGDSCPYCLALNGKTIGITSFFLSKDEVFKPDGAEAPLVTNTNVGHPPVHGGCQCGIAAGI